MMKNKKVNISSNSSTGDNHSSFGSSSEQDFIKTQAEKMASLEAAIACLPSLLENITELSKVQETLKSEIKEFKSDVSSDKVRAMEIIGIFISLFTFASLEIKILEKAEGWELFSLSFVLFSGLTFFSWLIFIIAERWISKGDMQKRSLKEVLFGLLSVILLLLGGLIWFFAQPLKINNLSDEQNEIRKELDILNGMILNEEVKQNSVTQ